MVLRGEKHDRGLGAGDGEFNPALLLVERLICRDAEAQLFGVKGERAILICYGMLTNLTPLIMSGGYRKRSKAVNLILVTIISMAIVREGIEVDDYVLSVLMRDLVGHDRMPCAFLIYLHLWGESDRQSKAMVRTSHQMMAEATGLSKSAVQKGIRCLVGRQLVRCRKASATAIPEYRVLRPWRR